MIGLDTNVLVRYIAQDDRVQSPIATKLIESSCTAAQPGFVGIITLIELVWVSESCYDASRVDVSNIVRRLLSAKQLAIQESKLVWQALRLFENGSADFADYFVERTAVSEGCSSVVTFDKKAAKAGMTLLR